MARKKNISWYILISLGFAVTSSCSVKKKKNDSSPSSIIEVVNEFTVGGEVQDLAFYLDYGVVARGSEGIAIVNLKNPLNPVLVSELPLGGKARRVEIVGEQGVVLLKEEGIRSINLHDPVSMGLTSSVVVAELQDNAYDVFAGASAPANLVYLATQRAGLQVFDWSNPKEPKKLDIGGSEPLVTSVIQTAVADGKVFLLNTRGNLAVYEQKEGTTLNLWGQYLLNGKTTGVMAINGKYLYLSSFEGDLLAIDASAPALTELSHQQVGRLVRDMVVYDHYLIVMSGLELDHYDMSVYDLVAPERPVLLERQTWQGDGQGIKVANKRIYVLDGVNGIITMKIKGVE